MAALGEEPESLAGSWQACAFIILVLVAIASAVWPRRRAEAPSTKQVVEPVAPEIVPEKSKEEEKSTLSAKELARILGNSTPDDEDLPPPHENRSTAKFGGRSGLGGHAQEEAIEEVFSEGAAAAAREAGKAFLQVMEGQDSQLALHRVREASSIVLNFIDEDERNALLLAASEGHTEACLLLLERADFLHVDAANAIGSTALHMAAANDHVEICKALIASPRFLAGVNAENINGQTPLDFSLDFGDGAAEWILTAAGGRRNAGGSLRQRRKARGPFETEGDDDEANPVNALD